MTNASRPAFLRHFGRASPSHRAPDLADMGTVFALDEALQRGNCGALGPGGSPPALAVAPWRRWLARKLGS